MTKSGYPARGRILGCSAALVAALVIVPAVVRATQRIDGGPTPCSIRLNRGFASPSAKIKLTPPPRDVSLHFIEHVVQPELVELASTVALGERTFDLLADRSPETRRGPPNARLA